MWGPVQMGVQHWGFGVRSMAKGGVAKGPCGGLGLTV